MTSLYSLTFVKYVYSLARSQIGSKSTNYCQDPYDGARGCNLLVASLSSMHLLLDSILSINGDSVIVNACDASIGKVEEDLEFKVIHSYLKKFKARRGSVRLSHKIKQNKLDGVGLESENGKRGDSQSLLPHEFFFTAH